MPRGLHFAFNSAVTRVPVVPIANRELGGGREFTKDAPFPCLWRLASVSLPGWMLKAPWTRALFVWNGLSRVSLPVRGLAGYPAFSPAVLGARLAHPGLST